MEEEKNGLDFKGKRALVMGLGLHGGGAGAAEFLVKRGAKVTVTDLRSKKELAPSLKALAKYRDVRYVLGRHRASDFGAADIILKNPGVRRDNPFLRDAAKRGIPITSDVGIFFRLCPAPIIGVTGTRGKSTTTYLIWKFLSSVRSRTSNKRRVRYGGNIRRSVLSILPQIKKDDLAVLELSSFQLQDLAYEKKSPQVAVFTNLLKDHLNWHKSMQEYIEAKRAIFQYQRPEDHIFIYDKDQAVRRLAARARSQMHIASLPEALARIVDENLGSHYRPAAALAVGVARHFQVSDAAIRRVLAGFRGLEGRQEHIGLVRGIHFINDTTATIPDAAVAAILRFRKRAGRSRLILIAGGQDKKLDFTRMAAMIVKSVDAFMALPGTATEKILRESGIRNQESGKITKVNSMKEAVRAAYRIAEKGDYVVLSPGAASFGLFLNEFDRGDRFVTEVQKLKPKAKTQKSKIQLKIQKFP